MGKKLDVAKVLIQNEEGKFLAVQKSDNYGWKAGKWELPGGKINENEDRFGAGKREVKDETSLELKDLRDTVRVEVEEFSGEKSAVNCWILYTSSFSGDVELSDEHQEYSWVSAEEFLELDWHRDAGYAVPAVKHLDEYLK